MILVASRSSRGSSPRTSGSASRADFVTADLPGIVLWDDTIPTTWTLDNLVSNPWEVSVIPIRSMTGAEIDALPEPEGLVAGRFTNLALGPDCLHVLGRPVRERGRGRSLPFYEHEMEADDAFGLGPGEPIAFGDGGRVFTGETTAFLGQPTGVRSAPRSTSGGTATCCSPSAATSPMTLRGSPPSPRPWPPGPTPRRRPDDRHDEDPRTFAARSASPGSGSCSWLAAQPPADLEARTPGHDTGCVVVVRSARAAVCLGPDVDWSAVPPVEQAFGQAWNEHDHATRLRFVEQALADAGA